MSVRTQIQLHANAAAAPVGWRLLSGNNRVLGRGAVRYDSAADCGEAIRLLQRQLLVLRPRVTRVDAHRWNWELHGPEGAVISSGHAFDRLIRCQQGLAGFRDAFVTAFAPTGVVITGTRRSGSVA